MGDEAAIARRWRGWGAGGRRTVRGDGGGMGCGRRPQQGRKVAANTQEMWTAHAAFT